MPQGMTVQKPFLRFESCLAATDSHSANSTDKTRKRYGPPDIELADSNTTSGSLKSELAKKEARKTL